MATGQADMGNQQGNRQGRPSKVTGEATGWQGWPGKVGQNEQKSSTPGISMHCFRGRALTPLDPDLIGDKELILLRCSLGTQVRELYVAVFIEYLSTFSGLMAHFQIAPVAAASSSLLSEFGRRATRGSRPPYNLTRSLVALSSAHCVTNIIDKLKQANWHCASVQMSVSQSEGSLSEWREMAIDGGKAWHKMCAPKNR